MTVQSVEAVVRALAEAKVRYLIVGGLAVVAHGFVRFTGDIDLVLDPEVDVLRRAVAALAGLGYRPRAPVGIEEFIDPEKRRQWVRDKGIVVFSLASSQHVATEVDLFVEPPFDFETTYARAAILDLSPGVSAYFVSRDDLIAMKRAAGRAQDALDIEGLESLKGPQGAPS